MDAIADSEQVGCLSLDFSRKGNLPLVNNPIDEKGVVVSSIACPGIVGMRKDGVSMDRHRGSV